ncbi:YdcF family protein [Mycolicibacterium sp. 050158]|uniref:YdcF family protein n=1 Tax=Mycolicibacterium sp. 050158 TaxID=3090602 RepID=UPI00299E7F4D|nr:YdcF family protein [Mycolicibacterium sp. 050158]MDX1888565.1 YdcF family protein [Mycolicibacterium sp. 050158]
MLVVVAIDMGVSGFLVFRNAKVDQLERADAIIVLGGEHDGREDFGLSLARAGWARAVVISNPYDDDPVMRRVCRPAADIEVICQRPDPLTTRGEAEMMRRLADERHWKRVIVVSWRYHLPRARLVFEQCFSDQASRTLFAAVPRRYQFSWLGWELVYAYQWGGLAKAFAQGECA